MSHPPDQLPPDSERDAPAALVDDLRSLYGAPGVPPMVDARVRQDALVQLARIANGRQRRGRLLRWAGAGAAVAAAVTVVVLVLPEARRGAGPMGNYAANEADVTRPMAPASAPPVARSEDVDRNGRVDILDAFAMARSLEASQGRPPDAWDVTGDGKVDRADVDRVARDAVRVTTKVAQATPGRLERGGIIR